MWSTPPRIHTQVRGCPTVLAESSLAHLYRPTIKRHQDLAYLCEHYEDEHLFHAH